MQPLARLCSPTGSGRGIDYATVVLLLATLVSGWVAGACVEGEGGLASGEAALGRPGSSDGDDGELFTDSLQFSSADLAPTTEASDTMSAGVYTHTHAARAERERENASGAVRAATRAQPSNDARNPPRR
jgi:hypothetical protein